MIKFLRPWFKLFPLSAFEEGEGGSFDAPAEAPAPVAEPAPVAAPEPKQTMLEAITQGLDKAPAQVPRDPQGRFVPKVGADGQPVPQGAEPAPVAATPAAPGDEDLTAPEGLGQKAQERFQKLANEVKELRPLRDQVDMLDRQVSYVRETFSTNGIKQEQFEQAAQVIGLINKGDYSTAKQFLEQQLQQLAVLSGQPVGQIDPLASFPDLRAAVDGMQVTEQHALEIARSRAQQHQQQVTQQRTQEVQQTRQQEQQAVQQGLQAVDEFCREMTGKDMDFPAIEAQLLPELKNLVAGVHPSQWRRVVETQYRLLKNVASQSRGAPSTSNPLRPTGSAAPIHAPKNMFEAMFGASAPRA